MTALCYICKKKAQYVMKGTDLYYCQEHAQVYFADVSYLQTIDKETKKMKELIDTKRK
jgi:hypothetical protein